MTSLDSSSSEAESSSSDTDSDSSTSDAYELSHALIFLKSLVKIAKKCRKKNSETLAKFLATLPIPLGKAAKRRAGETKEDSAKRAKQQTKRNDDARACMCKECDKVFLNKASLIKHQESCKKEKEAPKNKTTSGTITGFKCNVCEKVLANKGNLQRHVRTQHEQSSVTEPHKTQSKSTKYTCKLCKKERVQIYRHYGLEHNIDDPEQLLFDDGTVLTISSIDTKGGKAPWFINQLEKANKRYKDSTCRLCEVEFKYKALLKEHYTKDHTVHSDSFDLIKHLFRAEKRSHLGETSVGTSSTNTSKRVSNKKVNVSDNKKKVTGINKPPRNQDISLIMYKCKCGVATGSYDASVEHAQKHLVSELAPDKKTCNICNFTFEASSFADHLSRHNGIGGNITFKVIAYDFEKLLTEAWLDMFQGLEKSHAEKILSSSLYLHSRRVKLHSDNFDDCDTGVLSYRCGMCQCFVDPAKIENHCRNQKTCIESQPKGHYCSECDIYFYTAHALAIHKDNHDARFRIVSFNNKNDWQFNNALLNLRSPKSSESDSQEERGISENPTEQENRKRVRVLNDTSLPSRFCIHRKAYVPCSEFAGHNVHQFGITGEKENASSPIQSMAVSNQNKSATDKQTEQEPQLYDDEKRMQTQNGDITADNIENRMEIDAEGTVEPWDSDSDSCDSFRHSVSVVHADINISVTENGKNVAKDVTNDIAESPEQLLREMCGANDSQASVIEDTSELPSTQDLQHILENDASEDETNQKGQGNAKVISQDIFSDDISQNENGGLVDGNTTNDEGRDETNNEEMEVGNNCQDKNGPNSRMSSKDIMRRIIPDDDTDNTDFGAELERSEFLELNALIARKMFSRD